MASMERSPLHLAVFEAMTAAAGANDGWDEVHAFIDSMLRQGYVIYSRADNEDCADPWDCCVHDTAGWLG